MPLSKQAKALYEAALRRKGLQPGKAVRQDPRTFIGPIEMEPGKVKSRRYYPGAGNEYNYDDVMLPKNTYWNERGRFQDLENELGAAISEGIWERKNPVGRSYYRYYNDGDIPSMPGSSMDDWFNGPGYDNPRAYKYYVPSYRTFYKNGNKRYKWNGERPHLTRLGELELESRADEMIENDYKDYLRQMYSKYPSRREALEMIQNARLKNSPIYPYLEELYPEF